MDKKETANTRNKLVQEILLQKERTSEIASFLLLMYASYNTWKMVLMLRGQQRELHTRMEGDGVSKSTYKRKNILGLLLSCLMNF